MGILGPLLMLMMIGIALLSARRLWANGFTAGALSEAKFWLEGVDSLRVPNWQSMVVGGKDLTPEQNKMANQVYVQAYTLALYNIKEELANARRDAVDKAIAAEERQLRRFGA